MPSRLRLFITLLGFAVLGASFYFWVHYIEDEYEWVRSDSSRAPAAETDEIWQVSATCQLPYLVGAVLRAKAKLKFYTDAAPAEIREWRNSLAYRSIPPGADKTDLRDLSKRDREKIITAMDYDAKLHARYTEWYVLVSKLEEEIKQCHGQKNNVQRRPSFELSCTSVVGARRLSRCPRATHQRSLRKDHSGKKDRCEYQPLHRNLALASR
jgi:hypothetical protein